MVRTDCRALFFSILGVPSSPLPQGAFFVRLVPLRRPDPGQLSPLVVVGGMVPDVVVSTTKPLGMRRFLTTFFRATLIHLPRVNKKPPGVNTRGPFDQFKLSAGLSSRRGAGRELDVHKRIDTLGVRVAVERHGELHAARLPLV